MKIHDAGTDLERQDKQSKIKRSKHQEIESRHHPIETLQDVITNRYKSEPQTKFTVRLNKDLATSLRVYADANDMSINQSIIYLCEKYFNENWITRGFFKLEKPFTVAIPIISQELEKYITDDINCIIDLSCDIESRLAVQSQLISKDETDYYLAVTFQYGNNYLDRYQITDESYYAGNLKGTHIGLYDIYLDHLQESIFIRVVFENKTPIKATILTRKDAMTNAKNVDNQMLINYIDGLEQSHIMDEFKQRMEERELYIKTLEQRVQSLENELSDMKKENTEQQDQDKKPQRKKNLDQVTKSWSVIPPETQKSIIDAMVGMNKTRQIILETMKPFMDGSLKSELEKMRLAGSDKESDDMNS